MPIEQKRIEAAIREYRVDVGHTWTVEGCMARVLAAAFPELASDPPTGWVAPWEKTGAMIDASLMSCPDDETWAVYRDAHIKDKP